MSRSESVARGRLKIFLSYAAGAGKTYRMLDEAQQLKKQGMDVVVGYFEPHGRKDTIDMTEGLEIVPRRQLEYRGCAFEEMDTDAILRRAPKVCAVDEFPHTNIPGSKRVKRWEDVMVLLDAGIDVMSTMNLQHLESLNDEIFQISGIRVRETMPDWVIKQADEVVMVDVTPEALLNRLRRGVVYAPDKATRALENFFKEQTLTALRELALRQAAHEVDVRLARQVADQRPAHRDLKSEASWGGPAGTTSRSARPTHIRWTIQANEWPTSFPSFLKLAHPVDWRSSADRYRLHVSRNRVLL